MTQLKAFGIWDSAGIEVADPGLKDYIALQPVLVPRTGGRYAKQRFYKSRTFIVERLMNKLMVTGHKGKKHRFTSYRNTGKSSRAYKIVKDAFTIIEQKARQNPVRVFVAALENAAPREEIISVQYGGARYPKAVECSPQRRIDVALRYMVQGAYGKSFNSKSSAAETLADEIIAAYNKNANSFAISRKLEIERQADSSR